MNKAGKAVLIKKTRRLFPVLFIFTAIILLVFAVSCKRGGAKSGLGNGIEKSSSMHLDFAEEFSVDYYDGGYKLISLTDGSRYLTVPEGATVPKGIDRDIVILHQPLDKIYLASSSAMCLFDGLDSLDRISYTATKEESWHIDSAKEAMQRGEIAFAGKYSEPDYEMLINGGCKLAVENTMIGHASGVKDKLEKLGIPVIVERSSYEKHPLGRSEWIKLYAALFDLEYTAARIIDEQKEYIEKLGASAATDKTVVFFHVSSSGYAVCRKSGDYVSKMIALAGGKYVFDDLGDDSSASATANVEMETFFSKARDADIIIYNSTIAGTVDDLDAFLALNPMFSELKAVKTGNCWCTNQNMYQQSLEFGKMIHELNAILNASSGDVPALSYFYHLD